MAENRMIARKELSGKIRKKRIAKEKNYHRKREKGQKPQQSMMFPIRRNLFSRIVATIILNLSGVCEPVSFMGQAQHIIHFPLPAKRQRKIIWLVKAPLNDFKEERCFVSRHRLA